MSTSTTTGTPVVVIDEVHAGYLPGVNILNGCSLVANQGELIGIIGPNGAGKSTLLKAIFGQVHVREGSISLEGEDITGLKANKLVARGVGFIPQTNNVFPSLTIEENLQMGLYQRPGAYAERLEFVTGIFSELGKRLKQRAGSLSGGERQMVAMGRALMMDPKVLLLDEPSSGLDRAETAALAETLRDIQAEQGFAILLVEHDVELVSSFTERCYVLDFGRVIAQGPTAEVLAADVVRHAYLGDLEVAT